ncbi:MAG: hypothetical protein JXC32_17330, partial [Anaerolineae bacterium]|nr:hypothetical protein [Anaerolineae bacterium]
IGPLPADLWDLIGAPLPTAALPSVPPLRSLAPDQPDITDADQDRTDHVSANDTSVGHVTVHRAAADPAAKRDSYRHPGTTSNAPSPETSAAPGVPSGVTRTPGSGPIQRVLAPSASSAAATGTATTADTAVAAPLSESAQAPQAAESSGGTTPGTGQEPDIDIAELARRVYAEIKRRLRVERERSPWH